jgi:TRAP-type C4-dicarboxylate transport system permease small subunit
VEVVEKAYAAWRAFQDRVLAPVAALLFVGSTLLALLEVGRRYVLGRSFEWQQDAVTFFILSGVFLYFSISQRRSAHLAVTLVPEILHAGGGRPRSSSCSRWCSRSPSWPRWCGGESPRSKTA